VAPAPGPANGTVLLAGNVTTVLLSRGSEILGNALVARQEAGGDDDAESHPNSVVYIFRCVQSSLLKLPESIFTLESYTALVVSLPPSRSSYAGGWRERYDTDSLMVYFV
jgi:hypothetical protein